MNENTEEVKNQIIYKDITFMCTNADSLSNKMDKLKTRISLDPPDILAICETWLQEDPLSAKFYPSECLHLEGYNMYRYDNVTTLKGGIVLYVKPVYDGGPAKKMNKFAKTFEESAWHKIHVPIHGRLGEMDFEEVLFGCIYRKGRSTETNNINLMNVLEEASKTGKMVTICGDFNFSKIDWDLGITTEPETSSSQQFLDTINDLFLTQHVDVFTRMRGTDEPSTIDLVLTDSSQIIQRPVVREPLGKSDHGVVIWKSTFATNTHNEENFSPKFNFFKGKYQHMRDNMQQIDWDSELKDTTDVNVFANRLEEIIKENIQKFVPLQKKPSNKYGKQAPWLDRKALKAVKRKFHAWRRFQQTKSHVRYMEYVKERNKSAKKLRKAKRAFEENLAKECSKNPKAFFRYANYYKKRSTNFIRLTKTYTSSTKDKDFTQNDEETAEELNSFFKSVFTTEKDRDAINLNYFMRTFVDPEHPKPFDETKESTSTTNILEEINISVDDVYEVLKGLNPNKSAGEDGMHPRVLKECASELAYPVYKLFSMSLSLGTLPKSWKSATVTPIHKDEDRSKAENYRPISITSQLGKALEKIVRRSIMTHLTENNMLSKHQHGFCEGKSCLTNLLEALDDITNLIDDGIPVDEVFLDFRKAFDRVSHERLLYKVHQMGIEGKLLQWISSFLSDRKQRVKVNNSYSGWESVTSGVPQGSVLGPILFIIYINDFPLLLKNSCKMFADDAKLYGKVEDITDKESIQSDLQQCVQWANEWLMEFNKKKCKVIHFGTKNQHFDYHMDGYNLTHIEEEKDLGIIVSHDLKWNKQVTTSAKKANKMLGLIKNTFTYMNKEMFNVLYKTLVRPHLEYCPQVWSPYLTKDIKILENIQRRATKIVPEIWNLSYEDRLKELKLFPLKERRLRGDMISTYKMLNGLMDVDREQLVPIHGNPSTRSHNQQLKGKIVKGNMRKNFFTQRIILPWNNLSTDTISSETVTTFKGRYDKEVLGHYITKN